MDKNQNKKNFIFVILLLIYTLVYQFVIIKFFKNESSMIHSLFCIILFFISFGLYGFNRNKLNLIKRKIIKLVALVSIIGIAFTYAIGFFVGFLKTGYSLMFVHIIQNSIFPFITILFTELFRYNIIRSNKNNNKLLIIITLLLSVIEIQLNILTISELNLQNIFIIITTLIIPIVSKNIILGYLSYKIGYQACFVYRFIIELYVFFVPYLPRFGDYLNSMFGLILPTIVFTYSSDEIDQCEDGVIHDFSIKKYKFIESPMYILVIVSIALISRVFPIFTIGIGSESMTGSLNKGDAVIAYKVKESNISEGDIIVFQAQDKIFIHRVVEIEKVNGITYYRTKGDINGSVDNIDVTIDKVCGKVKLKIPYIAYPSVWLTELLEK